MAREKLPFQCACKTSMRIHLTGDLEATPTVEAELRTQLAAAKKQADKGVIVDADDVRVFPGGQTLWEKLVREYEVGHRLIYLESHLSQLMRLCEPDNLQSLFLPDADGSTSW